MLLMVFCFFQKWSWHFQATSKVTKHRVQPGTVNRLFAIDNKHKEQQFNNIIFSCAKHEYSLTWALSNFNINTRWQFKGLQVTRFIYEEIDIFLFAETENKDNCKK